MRTWEFVAEDGPLRISTTGKRNPTPQSFQSFCIAVSNDVGFIFRDMVRRSHVKIDTVLSYCRYGFYNNDLMDIIPELRTRGVGIINAAPLGLGLLSKIGPEDWHPASDSLKLACRAAVAFAQVSKITKLIHAPLLI